MSPISTTNGSREPDGSPPPEATPRAALMMAGAVSILLVAAALYLLAVRGDALFLDLAGLSGLLFCF
ncbi:MAG: hypothetical protein AB7E80_05565 [Hyphomicrobiaceae bacterium]